MNVADIVSGSLQDINLLNKKYLLVCDKVNNLGDLSEGLKVANDLYERLKVPLKNIFVVSNDIKGCELFNKNNFKIRNSGLKKVKGLIEKYKIDLQIIVPTDNLVALWKVTGQIPALALCEYNFKVAQSTDHFVCKTLGLGTEGMGILIDHSLVKWGFSEDAKNSFKRLQQLEGVNLGLQQAILGKKSLPNESHFLSAVQKFDDKSRLYMSYAREQVLVKYIKKIIKLNHEETKHLVFVLSDISLSFIEKIDLKSWGIRKRKIIVLNSENLKSECVEKIFMESGKKIKIVVSRLLHVEMLCMFKAAERQVVVTGDQSLTEAISGNMEFVYAAPDHKHELERKLQAFNYPTFQYETNNRSFPNFSSLETISASNKKICEEQDYFPKFVDLIQQRLNSLVLSIPSLESISDTQEFLDAIELDTEYIITIQQMIHLRLQYSGKSELTRFADSLFDYKKMGLKRYSIKRMLDTAMIH